MIYTIAAYSITLGVLALYAVSFQHRLRADLCQAALASGSPPPDLQRGFNVGAALLSPLWLWANGSRLPALAVGVTWLAIGPLYVQALWWPLVFVSAIPVAAGVALGFVGNRIALAHEAGSDGSGMTPQAPSATAQVAFASGQLRWAVAGILLHVFILPWAFFFAG